MEVTYSNHSIVLVFMFSTGNLCTAVNVACLALLDAGIPMRDMVVGCSAGFLDKTPLLGNFRYLLPFMRVSF